MESHNNSDWDQFFNLDAGATPTEQQSSESIDQLQQQYLREQMGLDENGKPYMTASRESGNEFAVLSDVERPHPTQPSHSQPQQLRQKLQAQVILHEQNQHRIRSTEDNQLIQQVSDKRIQQQQPLVQPVQPQIDQWSDMILTHPRDQFMLDGDPPGSTSRSSTLTIDPTGFPDLVSADGLCDVNFDQQFSPYEYAFTGIQRQDGLHMNSNIATTNGLLQRDSLQTASIGNLHSPDSQQGCSMPLNVSCLR